MSDVLKARFWTCVYYLEDLPTDWKDQIYSALQCPFAYCVHDKDLDKAGEDRKAHVHCILAYGNTTTYKQAKKTFERLFAGNGHELHKIEEVISIRYCFDYLIHATEDAQKKGKHLYDSSERVCGNGFDIGFLEQIDASDKALILRQAEQAILIDHKFYRYGAFWQWCVATFTDAQLEVLLGRVSHFRALVDSNYQKRQEDKAAAEAAKAAEFGKLPD